MDKEKIDYGTWTVPSDWSQITLKQFSELERYYADKDKQFDAREVLHVLCNKTIDEVNALPMEFTERIMEKLDWLQKAPEYGEPTNKMTINGEVYIANTQERLKTGEYVSLDTIMKQDKHNYAAMLAVMCRKEGEAYDSHFENEVLPSRIELFEKIPMMDAMRIVFFFTNLYMTSVIPTKLCLEAEDALDLVARNIETSRKNGRLSVLSSLLLKRKLKKLRKSIRAISTTS